MSTINHNHVLSLLQEQYTTINISFDNDMTDEDPPYRARNRGQQAKRYTYKARLCDNIKAGDHVIVDTPHNGLTIVVVESIDPTPNINLSAPFPYKWIVQKVDRTVYDELVRREEAFRLALVEVERQKQREAVLKDINEHLPPDSEARKLFDAAISEAKVLPHAE